MNEIEKEEPTLTESLGHNTVTVYLRYVKQARMAICALMCVKVYPVCLCLCVCVLVFLSPQIKASPAL